MAGKTNNEIKEDLSWVLIEPILSEKAMVSGMSGVYVFKVDKKANKVQIKKAFELYYGVKPVKVNVVNMPHKKVFERRKNEGIRSGIRKAYIYLPEGASVEI